MPNGSYGGRPSLPGRTRCANGSSADQSISRSISSSFLFDPSRGSAKALANPSCFIIRRSSQHTATESPNHLASKQYFAEESESGHPGATQRESVQAVLDSPLARE